MNRTDPHAAPATALALDAPRAASPADRLESVFDLFEDNYVLIRRLLPRVAELAAGREYAGRAANAPTLIVMVAEQTPYTTRLCLTHRFGARRSAQPNVWIRVFHDTHQVEVLERLCRGAEGELTVQTVAASRNLFCRLQHGQFLQQWLALCLKRGYAFDHEGRPIRTPA